MGRFQTEKNGNEKVKKEKSETIRRREEEEQLRGAERIEKKKWAGFRQRKMEMRTSRKRKQKRGGRRYDMEMHKIGGGTEEGTGGELCHRDYGVKV